MPKPQRQIAANTPVKLVPLPSPPTVAGSAALPDEPKPAKQDSSQKQLEKRWGTTVVQAGWVVLPTIILEKQKALGLEPLDVNIILQIAKHWWEAENLPHPAKRSIADSIGVTARTVQRRIAALERAGFIKRNLRVEATKNNKTTLYDLSGLVEKAKPFAEEALQERERQKAEREERLKRKRPRPAKKGGDDASGG